MNRNHEFVSTHTTAKAISNILLSTSVWPKVVQAQEALESTIAREKAFFDDTQSSHLITMHLQCRWEHYFGGHFVIFLVYSDTEMHTAMSHKWHVVYIYLRWNCALHRHNEENVKEIRNFYPYYNWYEIIIIISNFYAFLGKIFGYLGLRLFL